MRSGPNSRAAARRAWLRCAGGSPLGALAGKLLPLFLLFFALLGIEALILHAGFELPYRGDVPMMVIAAMLFIVAYQSLATLVLLLVRNLALGLSLVAIIASPAFGYAGVGLPTLAMNGFAQAWGALLPLRWYQRILFDQAARGSPVHASAPAFAILAGMALGLFGLAWWRLSRLSLERQREQEPPLPQDDPSRGISGAFIGEWRRVLADRGVFSLLIIARVFYGAFYPQPYLGQLVRKIPIAVVDDDRTPLSRRLIQALDADEAVSVAVRAPALDAAQRALFERQVFGILEIPPDTEREVLKGNPARIPAYVDSAYFLVFNRTLQGIAEGAADTNVADISRGLRKDGAQARLALTALSPAELLTEPLYNPTGGYASYVVPTALVLIIQQTLLMGAATLTALGFEDARGRAELRRTRAGFSARPRAFDDLCRGPGTVPDRLAEDLRLLDIGAGCGFGALRGAVRARHQLCGPGRRQLFQASRDGGSGVCRDDLAAILSRRRVLAARDDPACSRSAAPHFPRRVGDRRSGAHRSDGRRARRSESGLVLFMVARRGLFRLGGDCVTATASK